MNSKASANKKHQYARSSSTYFLHAIAYKILVHIKSNLVNYRLIVAEHYCQ